MNTYKKYCPNVFVAECEQEYKKGETITVQTKYGKENEHIVHNLVFTKDGKFYYSITRADGFNAQERAKKKAEKLEGYAANAEKRSQKYYEDSKEGADFLALGEPIKVGHHSEGRHRKLIERNWNRMGKSIAESEKAEQYNRRAEYWEAKAKDINLSMPESLGYYEFKLEQAKKKHQFYKDNPSKREHSYSLTYANKAVKEAQSNLETAVILWGSDEEVEQINKEKKEDSKKKLPKKYAALISKYGGFFAFNRDQFKEGYTQLIKDGYLEEGEKVSHLKYGLYIPHKNAKEFINEL